MPRTVRWLFGCDLALVAFYGLTSALHLPRDSYWGRLVDLNIEANLPTWYSSAQLLAVGVLLAMMAARERRLRRGRPLVLAMGAGLFTAMSLDEVAQVHEHIGDVTDVLLAGSDRHAGLFSRTGIWMLLLGPIVLGALVWLGYAGRHYVVGRRDVAIKLAAGALIFVVSAAGTEVVANFVQGAALRVEIAVEELGELMGVTILLWGVLELIKAHLGVLAFSLDAPAAAPAVEAPGAREAPGRDQRAA